MLYLTFIFGISSLENELAKLSGLSPESLLPKIKQIEHHRSHIASSFFASPFEEAACISIDGSGDFTTTMTAVGKGNQFTVLDSVDFPHSLGIFYTAFTQFLGFPHYGDEYKVMGMAPYGEPKYVEQLQEVISLTDDGLFKLDLSYFRKGTDGVISYDEKNIPIVQSLYSDKVKDLFGNPRGKEAALNTKHHDLAASVQKMTEMTIFHMMNSLQKKTGLKNICLSGGVAQNSVANGKIKLSTGLILLWLKTKLQVKNGMNMPFMQVHF